VPRELFLRGAATVISVGVFGWSLAGDNCLFAAITGFFALANFAFLGVGL